uniref:F-box domain-containing protein n=1 Tax=Setaria italica TaxID=4555 RepID=K4AI99_SETIT
MGDSPRLLPEDVLADILARLAPRSLAVSRGVCREWRAVVDARCNLLPISMGGFFILTNESETPEFFVRPSMAHKIAADLEHYLKMDHWYYPPDIADSCNGLLLLEDRVVNPATRQWVRLPPYPALTETESRGNDRYLAFDPSLSPYYKVVSIKGPPYRKDERSEGLKWPPSVCTLLIYSSSTGSWEERPFVREGPTITIAANLWPFSDLGRSHGVYWNGALYVYWSGFSMRITLSNDTYQVLPLPTSIKTSEYYQPCLGKSKNGVHLVVVDDQKQLQVWFLDEFGGKMEWVLKHDAKLQAVKLPKYTYRPWILQDGNYNDQETTNKELVQEKELDWDSDDDNDDGIGEWGEKCSCKSIEVFGFHPYREIIFLLLRVCPS